MHPESCYSLPWNPKNEHRCDPNSHLLTRYVWRIWKTRVRTRFLCHPSKNIGAVIKLHHFSNFPSKKHHWNQHLDDLMITPQHKQTSSSTEEKDKNKQVSLLLWLLTWWNSHLLTMIVQSTTVDMLMEEILHHLGCKNPVNNGINYQPQLVSRLSSINRRISGGCLYLEDYASKVK